MYLVLCPNVKTSQSCKNLPYSYRLCQKKNVGSEQEKERVHLWVSQPYFLVNRRNYMRVVGDTEAWGKELWKLSQNNTMK